MRATSDPEGNTDSVLIRAREARPRDSWSDAQAPVSIFRDLVDAAPDAMIVVGADGLIKIVNQKTERLFGYERAELLGQNIELLVPKRFHGTHPGRRKDYFAQPKARPMGADIDLWAVRKDGTEFPAEISLSPIETPDGVLVTAAIRDVTDQRRRRLDELQKNRLALEEDNRRMQEANRLKSEFLANMSHELRTPLNAIIGFTELMYKGKVGPVSENHREYLGDILNSSRHLLQLINDVLDLAKVESGQMDLRAEPTELLPLVTEVRDILRGFSATKTIDVAIHVDPALTSVVIDAGKLKQVLYNYLSNALKFTPEGGRVSLRVTPESEGFFRVEVEDTGIGIKRDEVSRLFVEFQQLDSGTSKKYAGTGLGLALTKRLVEAQGGKVGVRSTPGVGSIFWAVLPRSPAQSYEAPRPPPRLRSGSMKAVTDAGSKLLIIDDDPSAGRLMQAAFEPLGVDVICAPTPTEALRAIEEGVPSVIVLDVLMPEMSGYDLLECLRVMPQVREVPIILWTVKELSEARRSRVHSLAQGFVLKAQGGVDPIVAAVKPYLSPGSEGTNAR
jgi:protein-histidine pros-kinase